MVLELEDPSYVVCPSIRSSFLICLEGAAVNERGGDGLMLTRLVIVMIIVASGYGFLMSRPVSASNPGCALV